jgi:hypothetical protein
VFVEWAKTGAAKHIPPLLALDRQRQWRPPPCGHRLIGAAGPEPWRSALVGDRCNWPKAKVVEPPNLIELVVGILFPRSAAFTLMSQQFTLMGQINSLLGLCDIPCFLTREFRS